jgi:hypothetical protein
VVTHDGVWAHFSYTARNYLATTSTMGDGQVIHQT